MTKTTPPEGYLFYIGSHFYKRDLDKVERIVLTPEN
jgi:hypothetical protein